MDPIMEAGMLSLRSAIVSNALSAVDEREFLQRRRKVLARESISSGENMRPKTLNEALDEIQSYHSDEQEVFAILLPISIKSKPILIKNNLTIGKSSSCDVDLTKYGICENISDHHATIIHDKSFNTFEILNYGRHITSVDHVLLSSGVANQKRKASLKKEIANFENRALEHNLTRKSSLINAFEDNENREAPDKEKTHDFLRTCIVENNQVVTPCEYLNFIPRSSPGYAVLRHGSHLRFGCIEFVFCALSRR